MKKFISSICVIMMLIMCLAGCSGTKNEENNAEEYSDFPTKLTAEKIATIDMKDKSMNIGDGGIYYRVNDKYGIMSFDGKNDTGAIYSYCTPKKNFFAVVTDVPETEEMTIENMNNVGVVDATGRVIVPEEYASVDVLNDRFIKVCEVTKRADSKDDALVYYTERSMAIFANDDDTFFKGNWYVYDAETGKKVEGVSGTQPYTITAHGNYIEYRTDDREEKCVNANGEALPEGAELLDDGSYIIEKDGKGSAYDTNGGKLFDYSTDEFEITYCEKDSKYYLAIKYVDSKPKYFVVDKKGESVSAEFDEYPKLYGECLFVKDKLYNFAGETVCEGEFKCATIDKFTKNAILLTTENEDTTIIKDGKTVLAQIAVSDNINVSSSDFTIKKKTDDGCLYYSFKDKDYTLKGSGYGPWVVATGNDDGTSNLVDTISGENLVSNYEEFKSGSVVGSTFYAFGKNSDGTIDVFVIK